LMNPDGSDAQRLTFEPINGLPVMDPNGHGKIVFDSNRLRTEQEPLNTSDLFLMNADGSEQTLLTRGSSASWSPDATSIVYHRSASGTGVPVKDDPGAPTTDSVIFMANVKHLLENGPAPTQITTPEEGQIDDDPEWSPDGKKIVFTRKDRDDPQPNTPASAEIYVLNLETGDTIRLTENSVEERSAAWHRDGQHIVYSCRIGIRGGNALEICLMNIETRVQTVLTDNALADLGPTFSPDGLTILFQRPQLGRQQIWTMNADGTDATQLTFFAPEGVNVFPSWGQLIGRRR
jgi:TolB protein